MKRAADTLRVGIIVDHPARDLDGCVLLADRLARSRIEVFLIPFYAASFDIALIKPDLLVVNYVRPANHGFLKHAQCLGIQLAVLDTEGGLLPKDGPTSAAGIAKFLKQSGLDEQLALYMFWGAALRDVVVEETGLPPSRTAVTGCPRFDLALWQREAGVAQSDYVLVNTNFPVVNSARSGTNVDRKAMLHVGFTEVEADELIDVIAGVRERFVTAIASLATALPEQAFVLRPHPFERIEPYRELLAAQANITVQREGSAVEAMVGARCMLHVNCTTAVEALLCGVPPISLDFANHNKMLEMAELPSNISFRAQSIDETLDLINSADTLRLDKHAEQIEPFFGPLDGRSAERCEKAILATLKGVSITRGRGSRMTLTRRISNALGQTVGSRTIEKLRQMRQPSRSIKFFDLGAVSRVQELIAKAHNLDQTSCEIVRSRAGLPSLSLRVLTTYH